MMFCPACGTKLQEGMSFCPGCGAAATTIPTQSQQPQQFSQQPKRVQQPQPFQQPVMPQPVVRQKKTRKRALIIALLVVALVAIGLGVFFLVRNTPTRRYQRQIDLGNRYLSELKYDDAIAAFEEARSIDPKKPEAYIGLVRGYAESGQPGKLEEVLTVSGAMLSTEDHRSVIAVAERMISSRYSDWIENGTEEETIHLIEIVSEQTEDEVIHDLLEDIKAEESGDTNHTIRENGEPQEFAENEQQIRMLPIVDPSSLPGQESQTAEDFLFRMMFFFAPAYDYREASIPGNTDPAAANIIAEIVRQPDGGCVNPQIYPGFYPDFVEVNEWFQTPIIYDADAVEWVARNVFNCSQEAIEYYRLHPTSLFFEPDYEYEDGHYYCNILGLGGPLPNLEIREVHFDGTYYYIDFAFTYDEEPFEGVPDDIGYAVMSYVEGKDGFSYWSLYEYYCE